MTHDARLRLLDEWYVHSLAWELAYEDFRKLLGVEDLEKCPMLIAGWSMHEAYTKAVSVLSGDRDDWLTWWWNDAEHGTRNMEAAAATWEGKTRPIRTIADLCEIIEADLAKETPTDAPQ
jgi:hypothetical protein